MRKEITRITFSFKSKYQTPKFLIIKEYFKTKEDKKNNNNYFAEILFEIK